MRPGKAELAAHGGADVSLLAQQLDEHFSLADSLRTSTRVRLAAILSMYKALRNLVTFTFVALHLFFAGGRHLSSVADLLRLINSLEKIHTKVKGVVFPLHLAMTLLYDVSWRWILYLNRCVTA